MITQQMINDATKKYNDGVQNILQEMSNNYVAKAALTGGDLTYGRDAVTATTRTGGHMQFSSEGLVITDKNGHSQVAISGEDGSAALAHDLVAKRINGYTIEAANILSGTIEAGVQIKAPYINGGQIDGASMLRVSSDEGNCVMTPKYGFSTTQGLKVSGLSNLEGGVNIGTRLNVDGTTLITGNLIVVGQIFIKTAGIEQIVFQAPNGIRRGYLGFWDSGKFQTS